MIEFEITKASHSDYLGRYQIFFDDYTLGTHPNSDFRLNDPTISHSMLIFSLKEEGLSIGIHPSSEFYLSNGKKFSGKKFHRPNEIIQIGETEIKILQFKSTIPNFDMLKIQKDFLDKNINIPEVKETLDNLRNEFLYLENKLSEEKKRANEN